MGDKIEEVQLPPLDVTDGDVRVAYERYPQDALISVGHARHEHASVNCRTRQLREALAERDRAYDKGVEAAASILETSLKIACVANGQDVEGIAELCNAIRALKSKPAQKESE